MAEIVVKLGENVIHKYFVDKDILNIGRARDNDIVIENLAVSRNHARIRRMEGKYILTDLNSANGTFVNGVRITKTEIMHNDVLTIGKHNLIFINKPLSDEQIISDAFGAERTMIVDRTPSGMLVVTTGKQKNQEFKITKHETFIGRSANNDIRIHDWFVSKTHAQIVKEGSTHFIKDLGSWRGVFINGEPIKDSQLKDGDDIKLGATHLTFHIKTEEPLRLKGRVPRELGYEEREEEESEFEEVAGEKNLAGVKTPVSEQDIEDGRVSMGEAFEQHDLEIGFEKLDEDEEELKELEDYEKDLAQFSDEMAEIFVSYNEPESEDKKEEAETPVVEEAEDTPDEEQLQKEIAMWEKALENKSELIRREAVRMLKKLTGKDYDSPRV